MVPDIAVVASIRTLVAAARAGDQSAFRDLIEDHSHPAYCAALAVLGSPEDARDAVQDAAIRAWQRLPDLRDESAWPGWFYRIATRTAIDHARRRKRRREDELPESWSGTSYDPASEADERLSIFAALSRLSSDDREVLGLRFGADLQVPDVAVALGIPLGTAKARIHRALGRLRKELGEEHGDS